MGKDWIEWHAKYDNPQSSLAQRLEAVRGCLQRALTAVPASTCGEISLISVCAGEGRDVLPVLAAADHARQVRALLVELNPLLADRARVTAAKLGLRAVEVRTADAGLSDAYAGNMPARIVLACGVFGNITSDQTRQVIGMLPSMLANGGIVIWTRGRGNNDTDPSLAARQWFAESGFIELAFIAPAKASYRVGMHQLSRASTQPLSAGTRMFTFT